MAKLCSKNALRKIAGLCLKSAKVLMASGAETNRVETTVEHIGQACGTPVESYATPTGITVTVGRERTITIVTRVKNRTIDLAKVIAINSISRDLAAGKISFQSADKAVDEIIRKAPLYSQTTMYIFQAICCAGFGMMIAGNLISIIPSLLVGLLAKYVELKCAKLAPFLMVFLNGLAVTIFADIWCLFFSSVEHRAIVIAGMVPLLPGLALTNAIADLMAGELLAGIARTTDAVLTSAALAAGAVVGMSMGQWFL